MAIYRSDIPILDPSFYDLDRNPWRISDPDQIKPDLYYVHSWIDGLKTDEGERLGPVLRELREAERIAWVPGPTGFGHAYLGRDVLTVVRDPEAGSLDEKSAVDLLIERLSQDDVMQIVRTALTAKVRGKKTVKSRRYLERLEIENEMLKKRLAARPNIQEKVHTRLQRDILQWLTAGRRVEYIGDFSSFCGVYVLFRGGTPVYVGQSMNIPVRLAQHRVEKKGKFDSVRFFQCEREELTKIETLLIKLFRPELNGQYKNAPHPSLRCYRMEDDLAEQRATFNTNTLANAQ